MKKIIENVYIRPAVNEEIQEQYKDFKMYVLVNENGDPYNSFILDASTIHIDNINIDLHLDDNLEDVKFEKFYEGVETNKACIGIIE